MICYFNRTDSSGFVRMGLFGLIVLVFGKGRSVTEGAGRHVAVSMKCTLTVMLMGSAGSASLLICVFCLVLKSTVLSSQPFLLSEQACSPPGPWLLQSLFCILLVTLLFCRLEVQTWKTRKVAKDTGHC